MADGRVPVEFNGIQLGIGYSRLNDTQEISARGDITDRSINVLQSNKELADQLGQVQ